MAGQLGAFHPAPLPLGACGAYTTAVGSWAGWAGGWGGRTHWQLLASEASSFPKILQHQAALLAAAQGPGLGQVAAVAAQMQHVAAFSLVAAPLLPAAGKRPKELEPWLGKLIKCHFLILSPPLAANTSPGGNGPGALPGLPAPMGVNGFSSLTSQNNGQPGSDTLYNNGLSPYPGGSPYSTDPTPLEMEWEEMLSRRGPA